MAEMMSQKMDVPLVRSQHHHAHFTSVMAENGIKEEKILGIALDGAGYGENGQIWVEGCYNQHIQAMNELVSLNITRCQEEPCVHIILIGC